MTEQQRMNGSGQAMQINPIEVALFLLSVFREQRVLLKPSEAHLSEPTQMMLQAIASGTVRLGSAQELQQPLPLDAPAPLTTQ